MKYNFWGIVSLVLFLIALSMGFVAVARESAGFALLYLAGSSASWAGIFASYCAKCPCRSRGCAHVLPGMLSRLFRDRTGETYSSTDIVAVAGCLLFLVGFPQYWLLRNPVMAACFWLPAAAAVPMILYRVCPACSNTKCAVGRLLTRGRVT